MGRFLDAVTRRITEVTTQQGIVRARADAEIAALQEQVNTLLEIDALLKRDPNLEPLYLKAITLKLGLPQE